MIWGLIVASYLVGALPFGLWTAKLAKGIDIRERGSGNIGATNVGREIGWKWGGFVLFLDALKGLLPTLSPLAAKALGWASFEDAALTNAMVACGMAAAIGHMFPAYLGFRGGKGVATGLGVATAVAPWAVLIALLTFIVLTVTLRWVGLSSVCAAAAFAIAQTALLGKALFAAESWPLTLFTYGVPLLIIVRHRSNIGRLLRGEEPKTFGKQTTAKPIDLNGDMLNGESLSQNDRT